MSLNLKNKLPWIGLFCGILLSAPALFLALVSAGAGHGHYLFAKVFYPFTMLSTLWVGSISLPFILFALVQFPLVGLLIGVWAKNKKYGPIIAVLILHLALVALNFVIENPSFS